MTSRFNRPFRQAVGCPSPRLACLVASLALMGCTGEKAHSSPTAEAGDGSIPMAVQQEFDPSLAPAWGNDDPNNPQPDPSPLGAFDLWEDIEGGLVCRVELENVRTIGGYTLNYDEDCLRRLGLEEPTAWFAAEDEAIVLIDATRKILVRLPRLENGDYYAQRKDQGQMNLNLTRPTANTKKPAITRA